MRRKGFALLLVFLQLTGPAWANVLMVDEVSVVGAAADDYYTGRVKPKLKVIEGSNIGQTLVSQAELSATMSLSGLTMGAAGIAGIAYYERTGKDPVYALNNAVASGLDAVFQPAYQAFKANFISPESYPNSATQYVGQEGSVGGTVGDLLELAKSHPDTFPNLEQLRSDNTSTDEIAGGSIQIGDIVEAGGQNYIVTSGPVYAGTTTFNYWNTWITRWTSVNGVDGYIDYPEYATPTHIYYMGGSEGGQYYSYYNWYIAPVSDPATINPSPTVNYEPVKDALQNPSSDLRQELTTGIRTLPTDQKITSPDSAPTSVPSAEPTPITNSQIQNFFTTNTTNVYNEYLTTVNNGGDAVTGQAAAETAKAQAEEAKTDSYSSLSANPFQEPYAPGEFDIPTRFDQFMHSLQTSQLFSFSNDFFNSVPQGGSPLVTIEGGDTFGSHSIDLSDTMSVGLAVLKSILLACFGFLSIRAVIMKR